MKYARIIESVAVDVVSVDPAICFHADLAAEFIEVPDEVEQGWRLDGEEWIAPAAVDPVALPAPRLLQLSPPTFLLQFTSAERIAIRAARKGEGTVADVLDDWFAIIEDPRLQYVDLALQQTQDGIDFLVTAGLITEARASEIKQGVPA